MILGIEEEQKETEEEVKENKELFDSMKEILSEKVKDVRVSKRLKTIQFVLLQMVKFQLKWKKY